MNILFVAPQPFLVNRGTPIAVKEMIEALGLMGHNIDLLTYHLGETPKLKNVRVCRIPDNPIRNVPTAFSINKLILDIPLAIKLLKMSASKKYDVIHCVEESIFIALFMKWIHRKPCIFDIDSSMPDQLAQKSGILKLLNPFFTFMEKWAIRRSLCCITVCRALSDNVQKAAPAKSVFQIEDMPLVPDHRISVAEKDRLKEQLGMNGCSICCYMGNFSRYQGIDLMFQAFSKVIEKMHKARILIIGGSEKEVEEQKRKASETGILDKTVFTGKKSPEDSARLMQISDVLLSPRVEGTNTPMKIYTYMASGIPVVATRLWTHTQVLDDNSAVLVPPNAEEMSKGILRLLENSEEGRTFTRNAERIIEEKYSRKRYLEKLYSAYDWIEKHIR
jgi:glycosyltransferase involved in cell wall biosynthesis